jgi:hypothetical protein
MKISSIKGSILPASLAAAFALLALQGCASGAGTGGNTTASGSGTTNKDLLMHMGISETSYSSRQAGGRG